MVIQHIGLKVAVVVARKCPGADLRRKSVCRFCTRVNTIDDGIPTSLAPFVDECRRPRFVSTFGRVSLPSAVAPKQDPRHAVITKSSWGMYAAIKDADLQGFARTPRVDLGDFRVDTGFNGK